MSQDCIIYCCLCCKREDAHQFLLFSFGQPSHFKNKFKDILRQEGMSQWASLTVMSICLESVCSLCHALSHQDHSFPRTPGACPEKSCKWGGGRGRLFRSALELLWKRSGLTKNFLNSGVSLLLHPSLRGQGGGSEAALLGKTSLQWEDQFHPRWSF